MFIAADDAALKVQEKEAAKLKTKAKKQVKKAKAPAKKSKAAAKKAAPAKRATRGSKATSAPAPEPEAAAFAIGTKWARKWDDGVWYSGTVEKVAKSGKKPYSILYKDGDKEKATADEVAQGLKDFEKEFGKKSAVKKAAPAKKVRTSKS